MIASKIKLSQRPQKCDHYIDSQFPPDRTSLLGGSLRIDKEDCKSWEKYEWKHVSELEPVGKYTVSSHITGLTVTQGQIGNCYYVSALVALALTPSRISRLAIAKQSDGSFEAQVFPSGRPTKIKLDGYFPFSQAHRCLAFSRSESAEMWPMLLEKAWAKHVGSYQSICGMSSSFAFVFLTGYPIYTARHEKTSMEEMWKLLVESQAKGFPMVGSSCEPDTKELAEKYESLGLVSSHAYTILSVKEEIGTKRRQRLVQLRNPWGRLEWVGGVGTASNVMPSAVMQKDAGAFYINFEEFYRYFSSVTVCKFHPDYFLSPEEFAVESDNQEFLIQIEVPSPCHIYLQLNEDFRKESVVAGLLLGYQNPQTGAWEYIDSLLRNSYHTCMECDLKQPGKYHCFVQMRDGLKEGHERAVLVVCCSKAAKTKRIIEEDFKVQFVRSALRSCAVKRGKRSQVAPGIYQYDCFAVAGVYYSSIYYMNTSSDTTLFVETKYKGADMITMLPPFVGDTYRVEVPPRSDSDVGMQVSPSLGNVEYTIMVMLKKTQQALLQEIKHGKMHPSSRVEVVPWAVTYNVYEHDAGMVFEFSNRSKNLRFIGKFTFEMQNMRFEPDQGSVLEIVLTPGQTEYRLATTVDIFARGTKYAVRYNHVTRRLDRTGQDIIDELVASGRRTDLKENTSFLATKYIDGDYCMYVYNGSNKRLNITLTIKKPRNLKCADLDKWEVTLEEGKGELKKLAYVKPFDETECAYSISYSFK